MLMTSTVPDQKMIGWPIPSEELHCRTDIESAYGEISHHSARCVPRNKPIHPLSLPKA